jgi:hypothetical protein
MVQLSVTRCICIAILSQSSEFYRHKLLCCFLMSVVDFVIDSVRKLLDTPSYSIYNNDEKQFCAPGITRYGSPTKTDSRHASASFEATQSTAAELNELLIYLVK